jgi:hypothetical protein
MQIRRAMRYQVLRLCCVLPLLATISFSAGCTPQGMFEAQFSQVAAQSGVGSADSRAVIPTGMRRTKHGWEDASRWFPRDAGPKHSLEYWLAKQRLRENNWRFRVLDRLRSVSPVAIALTQIVAICLIFWISRLEVGLRRRAHRFDGGSDPRNQARV